MIERLIALISNPWTWVFIAFVMLLPYILVFIRRFYPTGMQEKIVQCELKMKENAKNGSKKQENKVFFVVASALTLLFSIILIGIAFVLCESISQKIILNAMMSAGMFSLGVISVFNERFYKYALKEKYKNYFCESEKSILRYASKIGYLFIVIGLYGFVSLSCIGETFHQRTKIKNITKKEMIILEKNPSLKNINGLKINISGFIEGESNISLMLNNKKYKTSKLNGDFSINWGGDWYADSARIIYQPISVKNGHILIQYQFEEI